ncbi:hypothetical protein DSECCO2_635800 [anaerobic digester metagenome]
MKILIDIGHPAHVHYFRNFIQKMKLNGCQFLIFARDKEVTYTLLKKYGIQFRSRGKGKNSLFGKLIYLLKADLKLFSASLRWKPDLFMSFGSPYAAHAAFLTGKPHIGLTDTEHAKLGILSFAPFTNTIITPESFYKSFGRKQVRFNGFFELCYLHPKYFKADKSIRNYLKLGEHDKFVLLRFISWKASHDIGQAGITYGNKIKLLELLTNHGYKVFISAEGDLPPELERHRIKISPEQVHDVLAEADLFVGESGTMATEAAILGTPSVYVNSLDAGVFRDEVKYGLLYSFRSDENLYNFVNELIDDDQLKTKHRECRAKMLAEKIDVTEFLVWFIENYPDSKRIMSDNPDYQNNFL